MKIEEKISVFFTNTIRHAQRHRLTAGDILSGPRRNERLGASPKANQAEKETKPRSERANPRATLRDRQKPTKADLGGQTSVVMPVENPKDHMRNAFLEFAALTIAIQDVTQTMCKTF
ncbi:hypothetical protein EVAR_23346_1 [Eumeta japonica]|uniref:Uncharacterized protein n=1 Tax=Eumeta variegata TaxID=151549 RepID=A0A4C1Y1A9_EUMVA|nr:hypothetical protein EVAR_23346_1 [Eumeta japonica]